MFILFRRIRTYGYNVSDLRFEIGKILGLDVQTPMILLGAGNLGTAIASHLDFKNKGFDLKIILN
jgi:redox-sensing transcriptional repressor